MPYSETPSALSAYQRSGSDKLSPYDYTLRHNTIYTKVHDDVVAELDAPELMQLFRVDSMEFDEVSEGRNAEPGGQVPMNEDGEALPLQNDSKGFPYTWGAYYYRLGRSWTRRTESEDDVGAVSKSAMRLTNAAKRTIRAARVDALDRGVDPTGTTQFLCADGEALIADARPNPDPNAGTWSNLEALGDITPDLLEDARLNALAVTAQNGDQLFSTISKIYIRPAYENDLLVALNSLGKVGTALNDINPEKGRGWQYEVINELQSNQIYYTISNGDMDEMGLKFRWRAAPTVVPINPEDPDVMGIRIRFAFAIGCIDPRTSLRGGKLNAK